MIDVVGAGARRLVHAAFVLVFLGRIIRLLNTGRTVPLSQQSVSQEPQDKATSSITNSGHDEGYTLQ